MDACWKVVAVIWARVISGGMGMAGEDWKSRKGKCLPLGAVVLSYLVRRQSRRLAKPPDSRAELRPSFNQRQPVQFREAQSVPFGNSKTTFLAGTSQTVTWMFSHPEARR